MYYIGLFALDWAAIVYESAAGVVQAAYRAFSLCHVKLKGPMGEDGGAPRNRLGGPVRLPEEQVECDNEIEQCVLEIVLEPSAMCLLQKGAVGP